MKTFIYLLFFLSLFSCQLNQNECKDSENFLKEFEKGISEDLPPSNSNISMFFKLDSNDIIEINNIELYDVYNQKFKKNFNFKEFLCKLFNEQLTLKKDYFEDKTNQYKIFKIDNAVEKLNLDSIKGNFCIKNKYNLSLNDDLDKSKQITVLYILFKNKYYISFDDYAGSYVIRHKL